MTNLAGHVFTMIDWVLCFLIFIETFVIANKDGDTSMLLAGITAVVASWVAIGTAGLFGFCIFTTILFVLFIRENRKKSN